MVPVVGGIHRPNGKGILLPEDGECYLATKPRYGKKGYVGIFRSSAWDDDLVDDSFG